MDKEDVISRIVECGVVPVIRATSRDEAITVIDAIAAGGIDCIEVTMTVPGAVDLISELSGRGDKLIIGAGSVLDAETARECISAGASFMVSPATDLDTIQYCNESEIAVLPGALTPTEILNAWEAGADLVKVFPAYALGGPSYLRSLKAPLPHIRLVPTGGISQQNAADFIRAGAEAIGVGADLVNLEAVRGRKAGDITMAAKRYREIIAEARSGR